MTLSLFPEETRGRPMDYVALLRGINVGGKHLLPMKDLAALFGAAGCTGVRTFIQSGNVLFTAEPAVAAGLPERVAAAIRERFAISAPVLLRTADELREVARHNPWPGEEAIVQVLFLAGTPGSLAPGSMGEDSFVVRGREVYLRLPNGAARTKLTNAWFDSRLGTTSTGRNWRTVTKLIELF